MVRELTKVIEISHSAIHHIFTENFNYEVAGRFVGAALTPNIENHCRENV